VFVIVFGVAKLAELIDWSRLHGDAVRMLGLGGGPVTALLLAGKGTELLLTAVAALALLRRGHVWLLLALAGWTADLALLAVVAGIYGDVGRLIQHGLFFVAFAGLSAAAYAVGARAGVFRLTGAPRGPIAQAQEVARVSLDRLRSPGSRPGAGPTPESGPGPQASPEPTRQDLPVHRRSDVTQQDLPAHGPDVTRQDLPVHQPDETRQDLPVRRRHVTAPEPSSNRPPDDATDPDQ
jgi:hypothetical protein